MTFIVYVRRIYLLICYKKKRIQKLWWNLTPYLKYYYYHHHHHIIAIVIIILVTIIIIVIIIIIIVILLLSRLSVK